jgi:tetratricopeptide (TPR) repeat protein
MALHFDDYVLAIQYFNKHIAMKPQKAEPYYYRAIAKIQLEDFTGAIEDCNKALDRNPFLHTALYARGFAYKQLQQYDKALIDLTQAIHLGPDNDYYKIHYIEVCEATEDYTTALNEINKLLRKKKIAFDKRIMG